MFKKLFFAMFIATFSAGLSYAGGLAEPVMEAEVIAEESSGSAGGWVVPLLLIAVIAAVASSSGSAPAPVEEIAG